ncbi:MotA/TolQ/ExbB proton channel family protein [Methyloprofundus sp.]|uniref:MotA/TolQ/ExbB proton channel family protein n=1 Tax=Methyloprofundus sp. TaxID=2020875 RepID=UPI003D1240AC
MPRQLAFFEDLRNFLYSGGDVLWLILIVAICLWCLIIERLLFFRQNYPALRDSCLERWEAREDKKSTYAIFIRQALISEVFMQMNRSVSTIKVLITLCPLLGLLGTVTGMIHVFDVMAVTGTGNARAMASGVSQATIPTMAGMVIAIAGLYFSKLIEERVSDESHHLADLLKYH